MEKFFSSLRLHLVAATVVFCALECPAASLTLAWDRSPDPVTGYILFYGRQSVLTSPSASRDAGPALQYTLADLTAGSTYYFAVKAYNAAGQSAFSRQLSYAVPAAATTTTAAATTTTSLPAFMDVTLAWSASPEPVTGYILFYGMQSVLTNPATSKDTGKVLQYTLPALTTGATYYFALKAYNAFGQSDFSNQIIYKIGTEITTSVPGAPGTTTVPAAVKAKKNSLLAAKGPNPMDPEAAAAKAPQAVPGTPEYESSFAAITVFDNSDEIFQIPVDWDEYNSLNGEARMAVGNIDGDKGDELIIGLGPVEGQPGIPGGRFQIIDDDFNTLGWGQVDWSDYNSLNGETWPACGDIDGDGKDEILIGLGVGGNGVTEVFDFESGRARHKSWLTLDWPEYCSAGGGVRPASGNINADPASEIILGLYPVSDTIKPEGRFEVLDYRTGHLDWGSLDWPEYNWASGETRPVCADINRTMRDEILLGLGEGSNGKIGLYSFLRGRVYFRSWLEAGPAQYRTQNGETRLSAGDFDGDGLDEILVGFGRGGQGLMELHDDGLNDFALLTTLQLPDDSYNAANGETNPALKGTHRNIPRFLKFLMKTFRKRNP